MAEKRVQLNADEENRLFQEAKTNDDSNAQHDHDSGDESNEESGVVQRGIPNGEEPEAPNSGTLFSESLRELNAFKGLFSYIFDSA